MDSLIYYFGGFSNAPTRPQTNKYMRGWCPYFALALHDMYNYDLVECGAHVLVLTKSGRYVDIRGFMNSHQALNGLDIAPEPTNRAEIIARIETGIFRCGVFRDRELRAAKRLAKKLIGPRNIDEQASAFAAA